MFVALSSGERVGKKMGSRDLDTCTIFVQSLRWLKSQKVYDLGHVDNFGKKSTNCLCVWAQGRRWMEKKI